MLRFTLAISFAALAALKLFGPISPDPSRLDVLRPYVALLEGMIALSLLFGPTVPMALLALLFAGGSIALAIALPEERCMCFGGALPDDARTRIAVAAALGALASFTLAAELRSRRES